MLNFDLLSICNTVCPGSLVHLYSAAPYIKMDKTSWTYSIICTVGIRTVLKLLIDIYNSLFFSNCMLKVCFFSAMKIFLLFDCYFDICI